MYFLLKMGIIHCYVSLPEGISSKMTTAIGKYLLQFCHPGTSKHCHVGLPLPSHFTALSIAGLKLQWLIIIHGVWIFRVLNSSSMKEIGFHFGRAVSVMFGCEGS